MPWNDGLDEDSTAYQIASSESNRVRVVAGPGTGKSFAMKRRVARLLESGVSPDRLLPVTFTRVAAEDLHRELVSMDVEGCEDLSGTTLHSLALKILIRKHVLEATGRIPRPLGNFETQPMEADLAAVHGGLREVRNQIKAFEAAWARCQEDNPGSVEDGDLKFEQDLIDWLVFHRGMLIGEVIPQLYSYLRTNPAAEERREYQHILVDEYQDLNKAEQGVIELMADGAEVCIVGDDDQSIYSFRHAHPDGIRVWEDGNRVDHELDVCRRCPTQVVAMANELIRNNQQREERQLQEMPENGEGEIEILQFYSLEQEINGVANQIKQLVDEGNDPGSILVLAQRSVIGTPIYEKLLELEVPVKSYYAESELDSERAQERFAMLRLFADRDDRVSLRWLLGWGHNNWRQSAYARLRSHCEETGTSPWEALEQLDAGEIQIPYSGRLVDRFNQIRDEIAKVVEIHEQNELYGIADYFFADGDESVRDIRELCLQIVTDANNDPALLLKKLTSLIAKPEIPMEVEDVRIMSLHKSKGLSSPVTIIAGCVEGLLPRQPDADLAHEQQQAQIEEHRRLFFVGISRVKANPEDKQPGKLLLTYSTKMPLADAMKAQIQPAQVRRKDALLNASRFIGEMGDAAPAPKRG